MWNVVVTWYQWEGAPEEKAWTVVFVSGPMDSQPSAPTSSDRTTGRNSHGADHPTIGREQNILVAVHVAA